MKGENKSSCETRGFEPHKAGCKRKKRSPNARVYSRENQVLPRQG